MDCVCTSKGLSENHSSGLCQMAGNEAWHKHNVCLISTLSKNSEAGLQHCGQIRIKPIVLPKATATQDKGEPRGWGAITKKKREGKEEGEEEERKKGKEQEKKLEISEKFFISVLIVLWPELLG